MTNDRKGHTLKLYKYSMPLLITVVMLMAGCASTTKPEHFMSSPDMPTYKYLQISELDIASDSTDPGALEANTRIIQSFKDTASESVSKTAIKVIDPSKGADETSGVLVLKGKVDVHYGSRALRYWVGFGAGKGYATITIKGIDKSTNEEKYSDETSIELSMGGFGGSVEAMIKNEIAVMIKKFTNTLNH